MTVHPPRAALRTAGTGALLAFLVTVGAPSASAHDELLDSSPGEGEHLDVAPTYVTLTFSDDILTIGPAVIVTDDSGATWTDGDPTIEDADLVVPLADDIPDGSYEVRWRVVSADGHPISGVVPFTVGDAQAAGTTGTTDTAPPSATAPDAEGSAPDTEASEAPSADAAASTTTDTSTSPSWVRPVVVGAAGALVATALFWGVPRLVRRRPPNQPGDPS
ncbi:copper resistance CopC family protein [Sanguibacter antarcticus]|uniref:CopC domain-containing protein n=1 Tax=Sanguibacter antarcticus TaxID=372484 RepID=A0A2A9E7T9_9MICO|nr:copper resistance protein CopC [Sanguibacter antarcticus]PFG34924.1 hypothetical protein ATL42_2855 [Sanguibacter antarcticus]